MDFNQLVLEEINPFELKYTVLRIATKDDKDTLIKGFKYPTDKEHRQQIYDAEYFVVEDQEGTIMAVHRSTNFGIFYIRNLNKRNIPSIGSKQIKVNSIEGVELLKAIDRFKLKQSLNPSTSEKFGELIDEL